MNKLLCVLLILCSIGTECRSQDILTINDIIVRAKSQSPWFKQAETQRELSYWNYRFFKANYVPQIQVTDNGTSLYRNSFTPITQPDGSIQYLQVNQFNPGVNIALQQPIQWTGGMLSINTVYNYFNDLEENTKQWNGSIFNVRFIQPVFAYNRYKWNKLIEPIRYEESKRDYAEMMEQISHDAVDIFFDVVQAQVNQQIAEFNLLNNDTIYKIEQGRYNIGNTSLDKLLQVELGLLRAKQDLAQAKLSFQTSSLELRTYIGVQTVENFQLVLPEEIPAFNVSEEDALRYARETRAAFVEFQRRKAEADANVAQAKGNRYTVNLSGGFGLNNVGSTVGDLYQDPARQQYINLGFAIPIIDWGRRKAMMQSAYAQKRLNDYLIAQDEMVFEQNILTQVRQFETLRLQIEISKRSDQVALERYNVAQNRYLIGKIDITNLNIALGEKDAAKRSYIDALKAFWTAYFDLRRLTLYDFAEQKYLYNPFVEE